MADIFDTMTPLKALVERHSVRRFSASPVGPTLVRHILACASRSPSGTNTQPWRVAVVSGDARARLSKNVLAAATMDEREYEYEYSPTPLPEPYLTRRRRVGFTLYELIGIDRLDMEARKRHYLRNFEFFGAPVGLFFFLDRRLKYGAWLDMGMFMQSVMIAARHAGLDTCPQQSWCHYGAIVRNTLGVEDGLILVAGMSLGYCETDATENKLASEREPVEQFATFYNA